MLLQDRKALLRSTKSGAILSPPYLATPSKLQFSNRESRAHNQLLRSLYGAVTASRIASVGRGLACRAARNESTRSPSCRNKERSPVRKQALLITRFDSLRFIIQEETLVPQRPLFILLVFPVLVFHFVSQESALQHFAGVPLPIITLPAIETPSLGTSRD